jgi:hypothetical protein
MSSHKSTKKDAAKVAFNDSDSLLRFAETLKLRSLADTTRKEYLRYVRKLAARVKRDPAELDEAQLRAHLLYLKDGKEGHGYSASSMRTAVAAFTAFYNLHLGRDWKLFRLVRSPSPQNTADGADPRRGEAALPRDPRGTVPRDPAVDLYVRAAGLRSDRAGGDRHQARRSAPALEED